MAYDIGLKIGIEGEAEYRKSIRGINEENKTLKTEMESVTSAFDKNDQSQEKLTKQNEILTRQIELQRKKIQESQVILEKATAEYGEADRKTQSWERTVNSATTELNKLERQLKENNDVMDNHEKKIDSIDQSTNRVSDGFGKLQVGIAAGAGAITAIGVVIGDIITGMNDMEDQTTQMNAVLKSTGGVSGMTTEEMIKMADAFEDTTKFAAEQTAEAENLLLTFTNIGEEVFPQATETLLDMATAMGTDAKGGAIQLGKALNDPTDGISALTRVGVTFTEEQKELIKALQDSGDMAGAQKVILQELQKEFGGSAKAAGETFSGQLAILNNSIGEASEELLIGLMPTLQGFVDSINDNMPTIKGLATTIGEEFGAGADTFKVAFDEIKKKVEENAPAMRTSFEGVKESWDTFFDAVVGDNEWLKNMDWGSIGTGITEFGVVVGNVATTIGTFAELVLAPFILVKDFFEGLVTGDLSGMGEQFIGLTITWQNGFIDLHNTIASVFNLLGADIPMWTRVAVDGATESIKAGTPGATVASQQLHDGIFTPMAPMPEEMRKAGLDGSLKLGAGIGDGTPGALINVQNLHDSVKGANDPLIGELGAIGSGSVMSMGAGIDLSAPITGAAAVGIYNTVTGQLDPLGAHGTKVGSEVNAGLVEGMQDKNAIDLSVGGIVNWVLDAFNVGFDIHSPAGKTKPIGVNVLKGVFEGMNSLDIGAFADSMVQRLLDAFNNGKVSALGIFNSMGEMGAALLEKMGISLGVTGGGLPVAGDITSEFGYRDDVEGVGTKNHMGIDIGAAEGTPIYAVESGTASLSTDSGYGNLVIIDNGAGLQEYYGHMSGFAISDGQAVKKGDVIGYVGSTGNSTGPHLHFGVLQNGEWVDPLSLYGGYATGTNWASPGLHWVGEKGPELINFRGGESVFTASESRKIATQPAAVPEVIERQPVNLQVTLGNGRVLAEYLIDDINQLLGIKTGIASRGMA